jgi:hypothetical protein
MLNQGPKADLLLLKQKLDVKMIEHHPFELIIMFLLFLKLNVNFNYVLKL